MNSVCVCTYNGEKFIEEQIKSILMQLSEHDEIIVSDDLSTDKTLEIIGRINDPRIIVVKNEGRHSIVYNVENALRHARGDYIFLADQDDVWIDKKVETCLAMLKDYDVVVSDAYITDQKLDVIVDSVYSVHGYRTGILRNLLRNKYMGCCMAFRREILEHALPFPPGIPMHDSWIGLIAEKYGTTIFIPDKLIYYRRYGENNSTTGEKSDASFIQKMKWRLSLLFWLIRR